MIVIMGITVIPTLYAWFNIAASWDGDDRYDPKNQKYNFRFQTEHQYQEDQRNNNDRKETIANHFPIILLKILSFLSGLCT